MRGLQQIGTIPDRLPRTEFQKLEDPYMKEILNGFANPSIIDSIEDWSRSYYTLEGHMDSIQKFNKELKPEPLNDPDWIWAKNEAARVFR